MIDRDDELDPVLADLFAAERGDAGPPAGARDRVKGALVLSVGAGVFGPVAASATAATAASTTAAGTTGGAVKLAAVTAAGTAGTKVAGVVAATALAVSVGAGGVYVATRETPVVDETKRVVIEKPVKPESPLREPIVAPVAPVAPVVTPEPVAPVLPTKPTKPTVKPKPAVAPVVAPVAPSVETPVTPEERASRLQAERRLLESARGAVAKGDSAGALAHIAEHRAQFKDGVLVEEREALAVQALAKAGRIDEARAQLATFKAKWPRSLFLKTLESSTAQ